MAICVEIEIDDSGAMSVGVCPPDEESTEPKDYMKKAASLEGALSQARTLLSHGKLAKPASMKEAMFGPDKPPTVKSDSPPKK
jgi:hypothetical protein